MIFQPRARHWLIAILLASLVHALGFIQYRPDTPSPSAAAPPAQATKIALAAPPEPEVQPELLPESPEPVLKPEILPEVAESKIETPDREKEKAREQEREEQKEQARQQKLKQERELARQEQMRQEQEKAEQRAIEKERAREQQQAFEEQKRQEADQARERELAEQRQAEAEAEAAAEAQQVAAASAQGGQKDGVSGGQAGGVAQGQPSGGGGMGDASPNYQAEVRAWLDRHKEYPVMARRRGQEGMAMVTFTFDRNGRILAYGLERETGHENLDQAVGDMIERADPLPAMPVDLAQNRMTWTMPVYFQLK